MNLASVNPVLKGKIRVSSAYTSQSGSDAVLDGEHSDSSDLENASKDENLKNCRNRKRKASRKTVSDHTYSNTINLNQELSDVEEDVEIPVMEHNYSRPPPVDDNMSDEQMLESLDLGADITVETLEQVCHSKVSSIRKHLGWLYHIRLGHASLGYLKALSTQVECLKNVNFPDEILDCPVCKMAKIKRQKHVTIRFRFPQVWRMVHSDLSGPITPKGCFSFGRYAVSFIDDFSRYAFVYIIPDRASVAFAFREYLRTC